MDLAKHFFPTLVVCLLLITVIFGRKRSIYGGGYDKRTTLCYTQKKGWITILRYSYSKKDSHTMFGGKESPEAPIEHPLWQRAAVVGTIAAAGFVLTACDNGSEVNKSPTSTPPVGSSEVTLSTTADITADPVSTSAPSSATARSASETEAPSKKPYITNADGTVSFPYEAYKDNPEQLMKDLGEAGIQAWIGAGANDEAFGGIVKSGTADTLNYSEQSVLDLSDSKKEEFAKSLFENPDSNLIADTVANLATMNRRELAGYVVSRGLNLIDIPGDIYHQTLKVTDVVVQEEGPSGDHFVAAVTFELSDNYATSAVKANDNFQPSTQVFSATINIRRITDPSGNKSYQINTWIAQQPR